MSKYVVSKDKSGLYYAHKRGFHSIPIMGSFCESRNDAYQYARLYNGLPNRVEQIEKKRRMEYELWLNEK